MTWNTMTVLLTLVGGAVGTSLWFFLLSVGWTLGKLNATEFFARRQTWHHKENGQ